MNLHQNNTDYQVKRLKNYMQYYVDRWTRKNFEPSVPEVGQQVESWYKDFSRLERYSEVNSPSMRSAVEHMANAYENRDNRRVAIQQTKYALNHLKNLEGQTRTDSEVFKKEVTDNFGNSVTRRVDMPEEFAVLYNVKRHVEGYRMAKTIDREQSLHMNELADDVAKMAYRYSEQPELVKSLNSVSHALRHASSTGNPYAVRQQMSYIKELIDNAGEAIATVEGVVPEGENWHPEKQYDVEKKVDDVEATVMSWQFKAPGEFVEDAVMAMEELHDAVATVDDPKAKRMFRSAFNAFEDAQDVIYKYDADRFGSKAWSVQVIKAQIELALGKFADFATYVRSMN